MITNNTNTVSTAAAVILRETGPDGTAAHASQTCLSSASPTNGASCATINKYGGTSAPLTPGSSQSTDVTFTNVGTANASQFQVAGAACTQTPSAGTGTPPAANVCTSSDLTITVSCEGGTSYNAGDVHWATFAYSGTAAGFTSTFTQSGVLAAGASATCRFTVALSAAASRARLRCVGQPADDLDVDPVTHHYFRGLAGGALVAATVLLSVTTGVTMAGFASGAVSNPSNDTAVGSLSFKHTYQSTSCALAATTATSTNCGAPIAPTSVPPSGVATATDAISDLGSVPAARLDEQGRAASCGVVQLKNAKGSDVNPLLPRYALGFQATDPWGSTSAVTLDGSSSYAAAVLAQTQPNPLLSLGAQYGLGIWFKTTSTTGGPLFEIGSSPTNTSGGDDRILYMTPAGKLTFVQNTAGSSTTTTASYNDGQWHFAYVTMSAINVVLGLTSSTSLSVDGGAAVFGGGLLVGYGADTGYWHAGWAPAAITGLASSFFAGALSNFVVFDNAGAPAAPSAAQRASQAAFNAWALAATEQWGLGDDGTTVGATPAFAGPFPVIGPAAPCSMVDIVWSVTNPAGTITVTKQLSMFADGTWHSVPAPGPGGTQTSTISLSRDASYNGYVGGLHLYAPLSMRVQTVPAGGWSLTFAWPGSAAAVIA